MNRYTVAVLVNNQFGVLNRVTSMFRRRQFNIISLTVSETESNALSRITVTFEGGETLKQQLVNQLYKLPDAMTGEITLQGRVLPIGGLREKSMAAYKNGMKTVIIPHGNIADLAEVDQVVKDNVRFMPVRRIDEVLPIAMPGLLNRETKPNTPCPEPAHGVQTLRQ